MENLIKEMHCFLTSQKSLSALKIEMKRRGAHTPRCERKIKAAEIRYRPQIASSGVVRPASAEAKARREDPVPRFVPQWAWP